MLTTHADFIGIAQLKAAPGKEEEMEKVLASMIEPSNAETGCVL